MRCPKFSSSSWIWRWLSSVMLIENILSEVCRSFVIKGPLVSPLTLMKSAVRCTIAAGSLSLVTKFLSTTGIHHVCSSRWAPLSYSWVTLGSTAAFGVSNWDSCPCLSEFIGVLMSTPRTVVIVIVGLLSSLPLRSKKSLPAWSIAKRVLRISAFATSTNLPSWDSFGYCGFSPWQKDCRRKFSMTFPAKSVAD